MKIKILLIGLTFICAQELFAQSDEELIRATLTDYIEGSTNGQPGRLKTAFHPDLNLYYVKNDEIKAWSGKDYILDTKEGQPTGEKGKILSIDYENNAAMAKVEIANPKNGVTYIDYFMLLKAKGKWTIIHKMFTKKK
ncbi:MAG: nuclear transport factor 2 family protein [Bacteroidota bacterium]